MTFPFRTVPFAHQRELFEATRERERFALFWEMGTGKTKVTLDTAAWLYMGAKINGLLILAPNGVHRNWITDEIPKHLAVPCRTHLYTSGKANTQKARQGAAELLSTPGDQFAVLAMSYDGIMTKAGWELASKFLETRRCLYVLDESARIKSPGAKRTKRVLASCKYAPYRRILTGTPVANSPFDAYTQMKFLDLDFWRPYHLDSWTVFKYYFGIWKKVDPENDSPFAPAYCVAYKNLEELNKIISWHSSRVTKDQVLDLPPKLYSKRYFPLNSEQRRVYNEVRDEFMTILQNDELVTAPLVIVRLTRLQQVTSGYIPSDGGDPVHNLGEHNPRLNILEEVLEDVQSRVIIWAKYTRDIDNIIELCKSMGRKPVRYDGRVSDEERADNLTAFQRGEATDFVSNPQVGGEGLTLTQARTVIYYNTSYKLTDRLQSEDRAHRIGQEHSVQYVDLVAEETVDEDIVDALIQKYDVAARVLGDVVKQWIES